MIFLSISNPYGTIENTYYLTGAELIMMVLLYSKQDIIQSSSDKLSIKLFIYKYGPTHDEMKMFCRSKLRYLT